MSTPRERKRPGNPPAPLAERLAKLVNVEGDDGCWIFTGHKDKKGYGRIGVQQSPGKWKNRRAHRVSYELLVGPIPAGLQLDHLCRVPSCVNPDHLEPVTNRENGLRGFSPCGNNARKTHCPLGHAFTPDNTRTKVTKCGTIGRECKVCGLLGQQRRASQTRTTGGHLCTVCGDRFQTPRGLNVHLSKFHKVDRHKEAA